MAKKKEAKQTDVVSLLIKGLIAISLFIIAIAYFYNSTKQSYIRPTQPVRPSYTPGDCSWQDYTAMRNQMDASPNVCELITVILKPKYKVHVTRNSSFYICDVKSIAGEFNYWWDQKSNKYRWHSIWDGRCEGY